jgi:Skp family chaperone for outer membrane proteins
MIKLERTGVARTGAALLLFTALLVAECSAQVRFAVVDMKRVFDGYYKTQQAETQIKDRGAEYDKVYKGMVEEYQKANTDYRKLVDESNDQAISAEERAKRKADAEKKLADLQEIEKGAKQYQNSARTTIGEMEKRMRENIVKEIRDLVNSKGKAANYSLIMDSAAQTVYQTPFLLFSDGQNDLTDQLIKELNATAPPGTILKDTAGDKK